ncbi:MAG: hypothetical protein HY759_05615 [Nitrospirae bacterium]|nr:hypothetical protein [Nitrospirota bacterium]
MDYTILYLLTASFIFSVILSLSLTPAVRRIAVQYGKVARPRADRWHKTPTALFGGVAIYLTVIAASVLFITPTDKFLGVLAGGTFLFVFGIIDDLKPLKPYTKLIAQIAAAVIAIFFNVKIELFTPLIALPLTVLWIVAVTNAFNLLDNMDGLSAGIAFITATALAVLSALQGRWELGAVSFIIAGAALGFLKYNFSPASIFMGDCGSMFLGFTIGALSIAGTYQHASHFIVTMAVPVLVMAIPIFDTTFVTIMRNLTGRSISQGGKDHSSHRLVILGLSEKKAVLMLYSLSIITGTIAIIYPLSNIYIITVIGILVLIGLFFLGVFLSEARVYSKEEMEIAKEKVLGKNNTTVLNTTIFYKRQIVEVIVDFLLITAAYISAYLLRFEGVIVSENLRLITQSLPILIAVQLGSFYYFGLYKKIWKYIGLSDVISILKAATLGTVTTVIILVLTTRFFGYSRAVFIIYWLMLVVLTTSARGLLRMLREHFAGIQKTKGERVLRYGAGDGGTVLLREINNNPELQYNVIGFIDDDPTKTGRKIYGMSVLGTGAELPQIAKKKNIQKVLIAISKLSAEDFQRIMNLCSDNALPCKKMGRML